MPVSLELCQIDFIFAAANRAPRRFVFFDLVAQLVEQYTFNVWVLGSSPSGITKMPPVPGGIFVCINRTQIQFISNPNTEKPVQAY